MKTIFGTKTDKKRSAPEQGLAISPSELRNLYFLREKHMDSLVSAAAQLDEGQRRLAVRLIKAMTDHRRSMLY
jgi:hypothetical protein